MDYAHVLKDLAGIHFKHARTIVLVQDNSPRAGGVRRAPLDIHAKASLPKPFLPRSPAAGRALRMALRAKARQLLDLAGSEPGVLSSQCLGRRIPGKQTLIDEIAAWEEDRNATLAKADWQFATPEARISLKHPYPLTESGG